MLNLLKHTCNVVREMSTLTVNGQWCRCRVFDDLILTSLGARSRRRDFPCGARFVALSPEETLQIILPK